MRSYIYPYGDFILPKYGHELSDVAINSRLMRRKFAIIGLFGFSTRHNPGKKISSITEIDFYQPPGD